jgi:hypothetical protein
MAIAMKNTTLYLLLLCSTAACTKPGEQVTPLLTNECGSEGHRIQFTVDNNDWCANASVSAIASPDGELILSGLSLTGQMFVVQIDSMGVGTLPVNEGANAMSWTDVGNTFTSTTDDPGELVISMHDPAANRISGSFDVVLRDAESPGSHHLAGSFDVTYTVQ